MHWRVRVGQDDALHRPTPLEKKHKRKATRPLELQETPAQHGRWCINREKIFI
jgi:hypothetical protein